MPATTPICCTACKTPLAVMYGERLYVGAVVFSRPTPLVCGTCGQRRVWNPPVPASEDSPNRSS